MYLFPPHFPLETFLRSQTATRLGIDNTPSDEHRKNLLIVAYFLETLRARLLSVSGSDMHTITVSSGYRSPELNRKVGGSPTSAHSKGLAADFSVTGMSAYETCDFIMRHVVEYRWDQLINEFGRWVHVGFDEEGDHRMLVLTAKKLHGATVYERGLRDV